MRILLTLSACLVAGCLMEPETKVIQKDHQVGPECLREDSTTWTDTTETRHHSCELDPTDPRPPAPGVNP
jgi:hypothetical protein